jgi:8-oxo-dGTP pyrophosphatase MutT (NUDIX family)
VIKNNPKNASAVILFYKNKVLMQLRSKNKKIFYPNHWGCFGGSKIKHETYLNCAAREVAEEINIKLRKNRFIFFLKLSFFLNFSKKKFIRNFFYLKIDNIKKFKKNFKLNEGSDYNFFTKSQVNNLLNTVPYDKYAIDFFYKMYNQFSKNKTF